MTWTIGASNFAGKRVRWSETLGLFCSVGPAGIQTSPDGETWTARTAPAGDWRAVCWSPTLNLWVVMGYDVGSTLTSPDGVVWTENTGVPGRWMDVIWVTALGKFIAAGASGVTTTPEYCGIATSENGTTWTYIETLPATDWMHSVAWSPSLNLLVAAGFEGGARIMTSPTGATWTDQNAGSAASLVGVAWNATIGMFAAIDEFDNAPYTSPNGTSWTKRFPSGTAGAYVVKDIVDAGDKFLAVGTNGRTLYSSNGTVWTIEQIPTSTANYLSLAVSDGGNIAVVSDGTATAYWTAFVTTVVEFEDDPVGVSDELELVTGHLRLVEDTIQLSDERDAEFATLVDDSITFSDARTEGREATVQDTFQLLDEAEQRAAILYEDSVSLDDAISAIGGHVVSDTFSVSDSRAAVSTTRTEISDTVRVSDARSQGGTNTLEDELSVSDASAQAARVTFEDTISLDDALNQTGLVDGGAVVDTIALSDTVELVVASIVQLEDVLTVSDSPFYKNPGATAWVMNTETGAPSWYSNWQFVDMVQIGDRVLAVGPEGLVELGAATDAGEFIDASISYGFMDYGTDQKKRVDSFWFGYSSDDVLEVSVETLGNTVYTYSMEARNAEQARNNRIRPGKGLNARYWRVGINNVGGCDFDVDSLGADIVPTSRRL